VNGYRAWKRGATPERQRLTDAQLLTLIRTIHAQYQGAYGSPRMTEEVRSRGFPASKSPVERLMSNNGIRARHKRRCNNRFPAQTAGRAERVEPQLHAGRAQSGVHIGHHVHLDGRRLAVFGVTLDLFNREIVGRSVKPRMTANLVTDALTMAWLRRRPAPGVLHHSDRGS